MANKLKLPRKFLSYTAISLWRESKAKFRERYYENIKPPETKYMVFGHTIEKEIAKGQYPEIPFWGGAQHELKTEIEGIPIIGYLDSFDVEKNKFLDYKTSTTAWTKMKVQKLDQLPFYAMLVWSIYGKVDLVCNLIWLETRLIQEKGLLTQGDKLIYTGKFQVFERKIFKWELKRMEQLVSKSAKEISEDFTNYCKNLI